MSKLECFYQFSVVIPYYNDPEGLFSCLAGIYEQQDVRYPFEVIVVDDCSDLDLEKKVREQYPKLVFYRLRKNRGPGAARNLGISLAKGQYLAFIDSDAVPCSLWLASLATEFDKGAEIICGPVRHAANLLARLTALTAFGEYQENQDGYRMHCPSVNYAVAANLMSSFTYDETIPFAGEDVVLSTQFTMAGLRIRYLAAAWILHKPRLSVEQYCRRAFVYGLGFKESRARCPQLSGYDLHKYLWAASAIVLLFLRVGLDFIRLVKLRRALAVNLIEFPLFIGGIILTRVIYAAGVFMGYMRRNGGE